jgi:hypothetical protein
MGSNIREARDIIGQQMLPVMGALAEQVSSLAVSLGKVNPETIKVFLSLGAALIALGPAIFIIGNLAKVFGFLTEAIGILIGPKALTGLLALLTPEGIILGGLAIAAGLAFALYTQMNKANEATLAFRDSLKGLGEDELNAQIALQRIMLGQAQQKLAEKQTHLHGFWETFGAVAKGGDLTDLWKEDRAAVDEYGERLGVLTDALKAYRQTQHEIPHLEPQLTPGGEGNPKTLLDVLDAREKVLREMLKGAVATGYGFTDSNAMFQGQMVTIDGLITSVTKFRDEMVSLGTDTLHTAEASVKNAKTFDEQKKAYDDLAQAIGIVSNAQDLYNDVMKASQQASINRAMAGFQGAVSQFQDIGAPAFGGSNVDIAAQRDVRAAADSTGKRLEAMFTAGTISGEEFRTTLKKIHDLMVQLGLVTDKQQVKFVRFEKQIKTLQSISKALAGLSDLAGAFDDQRLQAMLSAASHLADSVAAVLANPHDVGSWIGAISSSVALIKSLFGKSDLAISIHEAMKTNNTRLQELNQTMLGFNAAAAGTQRKAGQALGAITPEDFQTINVFELMGRLQDQIDVLQPYLAQVGLSFEQLAAIAKNLGINIFDKNGRLIASALGQLLDAINLNATIITTWNQHSLNDLREQTAISNAINGVADTAAQRWNDNIAILNKLAPRIGSRFAGVDVSTTAGQQLARQILQQILAEIRLGLITSLDLGDLQSLAELISLFGPLADSLNTMTDAVDGVNQALENVPDGFKLALATFDAMLPELPPTVSTPGNFGGGPVMGGGPDTSHGGLTPPGGQASVNFYGDIILPESDVTPRQQAKGIIREAMNMSIEQFGTPAKWSQLMVQ